jgi:hypothetical protein
MDIILIILIAAAVAGVIIYMIKTRKKGGCASCPYSDSCPSARQGGNCDNFEGRKDG